MASGCIISDEYGCWVCGDLVWEDDWMLFNNEFIHPACEARAIQLTRNKAILQNYEDEKVRKLAFDLEAHKEYVKTIERDLVVCKKEAERLGKLLMRRLKDGRDLDERRSSCTEEEIRRQIEDSD